MPNRIAFDPAGWLHDYGDSLYRYALLRVRSEAIAEDLLFCESSQQSWGFTYD